MDADKPFDCLKMKDKIQERLREERQHLTDEETRDRIRRYLETSSQPIARRWREIRKRNRVSTGGTG